MMKILELYMFYLKNRTFLLSLYLLIILFCLPCISTGQYNTTGITGSSSLVITAKLDPISGSIALPLNDMDYIGSPFLNENYELCEVLNQGIKIGSLFYRYNAYNEEIQVKKEMRATDFSALIRDKKISILIEDTELVFDRFLNQDKIICQGYLFNLINGKYSLFRRENIKFSEAKKPTNSMSRLLPAKFTRFKEYYLRKENGDILQFQLKKNKLIKMIGEKGKKRLLNWPEFKNKKIKKEEDLIGIFQYLNLK